MPVMDGVTATQIIRAGGLSLPIVGVTGNALDEDIQSFMAGGADEILVSSTACSDRDEKARRVVTCLFLFLSAAFLFSDLRLFFLCAVRCASCPPRVCAHLCRRPSRCRR